MILGVEYGDFFQWLVEIALKAAADIDVATKVHCEGKILTISSTSGKQWLVTIATFAQIVIK